MTYAVVIGTYNRTPGPNYLCGLVASLRRSGLWTCGLLHAQTLVIADGGSPSLMHCLPVAETAGEGESIDLALPGVRLSPNEAFLHVVEEGLKTQAPWVITLEDDVQVSTRFLVQVHDWLQRHAADWMQVIPLYCPYREVAKVQEQGATGWGYPVQAFYGTQALLWRRQALASYRDWYAAGGIDGQGGGGWCDMQIKAWHKTMWPEQTYFATPVPSLVQHIGTFSALGLHANFHQAPCVAELA